MKSSMEGRRAGYSVRMSRVVVAVAIAMLCPVPFAHASTVGVLDEPDAIGVALAGPDAVVLRQDDRAFSLVAVPRAGGRPQTVLTVKPVQFVLDAPGYLAASAARVALI